mmetsp:Transcript_19969/g.59793  ORF Transcript_19969/g.59793 Transcript_19969/m.59793 type:complete len:149 (-) Transcript_19969:48-494(-)
MDAVMLAQSPSAGSLPRSMAPSASGRSLGGRPNSQTASRTSLRGGLAPSGSAASLMSRLAQSASVTSLFSSTSDGPPTRAMGPPQTRAAGGHNMAANGSSAMPSWVIEQVIDFEDGVHVQEHEDCDSRLWRFFCADKSVFDGCPKGIF